MDDTGAALAAKGFTLGAHVVTTKRFSVEQPGCAIKMRDVQCGHRAVVSGYVPGSENEINIRLEMDYKRKVITVEHKVKIHIIRLLVPTDDSKDKPEKPKESKEQWYGADGKVLCFVLSVRLSMFCLLSAVIC